MKLDNETKTGLLSEYVHGVLESKYTDEIIQDSINDTIFESISTRHLNYILLVARLESLINVLGILQNDDNLVMSDKLKNDSDKFIISIKNAIEKTIKSSKERE